MRATVEGPAGDEVSAILSFVSTANASCCVAQGRYSSIYGGHAQSGRDADRGCHSLVNERLPGALRGCGMRDGHHHRHRPRHDSSVEDAAQGPWLIIRRALGGLATWARTAFHDSKNIILRGGSLLITTLACARRDHPREGNGSPPFLPCEVDKYTWQESGPRFCERTSPRLSLGADGRRKAHHDERLGSGSAITRCFVSGSAGPFVGRSCPRAANTRHMYY